MPLNVELFIVAVTEEFPTVKMAVVEFEVSVAPNEVALIVLICTLPVTLAKPVIVVLPPAIVVPILAKPVVVTPVVLAMKEVPTVNKAEVTETEALAKPVIVVLPAASVVTPEAAPANVRDVIDNIVLTYGEDVRDEVEENLAVIWGGNDCRGE